MNCAGTPRYMSPEAIKGGYSKETDVYAYGILAWELLSETEPWLSCRSITELFQRVNAGERPPLTREFVARYQSNGLTLSVAKWISRLWAHDRARRPSFGDIQAQLRLAKFKTD